MRYDLFIYILNTPYNLIIKLLGLLEIQPKSLSSAWDLILFSALQKAMAIQIQRDRGMKAYQGCRASHNLALVVVLRSMARANKLLLSSIPWNNTAKVGAHCIDAVGCQSLVILHHKISWVSLQNEALHSQKQIFPAISTESRRNSW